MTCENWRQIMYKNTQNTATENTPWRTAGGCRWAWNWRKVFDEAKNFWQGRNVAKTDRLTLPGLTAWRGPTSDCSRYDIWARQRRRKMHNKYTRTQCVIYSTVHQTVFNNNSKKLNNIIRPIHLCRLNDKQRWSCERRCNKNKQTTPFWQSCVGWKMAKHPLVYNTILGPV